MRSEQEQQELFKLASVHVEAASEMESHAFHPEFFLFLSELALPYHTLFSVWLHEKLRWGMQEYRLSQLARRHTPTAAHGSSRTTQCDGGDGQSEHPNAHDGRCRGFTSGKSDVFQVLNT